LMPLLSELGSLMCESTDMSRPIGASAPAFQQSQTGSSRAYSKRGSPESGLPLCKTALCDCLELLDHPHVPEPPDVIIQAARIANGVAKLESKRLWRRLVEDVAHTHSESGVVEDSLPARHGVRNRRRFLLFAHHCLATLGIPRRRCRFHRRREDQAVRELRVYEVSRVHVVA